MRMLAKVSRIPAIPAFALIALLHCTPAAAKDAVLELDSAGTQVSFTLGATLHSVHGTFKLKSGSVQFGPAPGHAGGLLVVDAASGESGNQSRDRKMHNDILESNQFPEITFAPQQLQGGPLPEGNFTVQVLGVLTIHGVSHPITLAVQAHRSGEQLTADTAFTVPYVSWGLKNPSTLLLRVNESVDVTIHAVGRIQPAGNQ
jgi:polyisoprenoid-binding protein YceI